MKILFLISEGFDTPGPSNHLISTLIEDVLSDKIKVHLIESRRKKINDDLPDNLKHKNNLDLTVIDRPIIDKKSFIKRYFEEAYFSFKAFNQWRRIKDIDVVYVQSCPTAIFSIILLKYILRKPIIYNIQDMFPGSAVASGVISSKTIGSVFSFIQKIAYKLSDKIVVISEDMKEKLKEQKVSNEKIEVIVNWYDDQSVHEIESTENRFIKKYSLDQNKFYVQYAGTMGFVFNYELIIKAAEKLLDYPNIVFQMIGEGSQKQEFVNKKENMNLNNIIFYPLEPQDMVSDVYSACTISVIPLKRGIIGNSVPSKSALLMACNRPIINLVDEDSLYYKMFNEKEMGISISCEDYNGLADSIIYLYENKDILDNMAKNSFAFGTNYYNRTRNTKKYIDLFKNMKINEKENK